MMPLRSAAITARAAALMGMAMTVACAAPSADGNGEVRAVAASSTQDALFLASARSALPAQWAYDQLRPEAQSSGALFLGKYCSACHAVPTPGMHAASDWPAVVRRMWVRTDAIKDDYAVPVPTSGERISILDYLVRNGFTAGDEEFPAHPDRDYVVEMCSRCHDLPDARQHTTEDWVALVRRMTKHMEEIFATTLNGDDFRRVIRYLEFASRGET